jgi:hypothetical protein
MANYQARSGATVMGISMIGSVEALGPYKDTGYRILTECGVQDLKPDGWYPVQAFSRFFDVVTAKVGNATLLMMGRNVANNTPLFPGTDSIEKCMASFDQGFRMFFRGVGPEEGWKVEQTGTTSAKLVFTGLFPSSYIKGMTEGFCKKFRPNAVVKVDEAQSAGSSVTMQVSW